MRAIPKMSQEVVKVSTILPDPKFGGLRVVRAQSDPKAAEFWEKGAYEFQDPLGAYQRMTGTLTLKGFLGPNGRSRIVVDLHPTLREFTQLVRYDPSKPPSDDYHQLGMMEAHARTQSDFKGQKSQNKNDFRDYMLEGIRGARTLYLPSISGWQSSKVFDKTVFVAWDETNPNALYGLIYLPRAPIMQADGQTQTAALFAVAESKDGIEEFNALENLTVSLEVELNVDERAAGQSFADRNGRGSKKNKNLVINLDTSSALSELRIRSLENTIFEERLATGRNTGTSETATKNIVDLSTMEQMLLNVISDGKRKPEQIKHHHVAAFAPFAKEFITLLEDSFGPQWAEDTPKDDEPFRRLYVHGWPFALKALALAYHRARYDELGPLAAALVTRDPTKTVDEAFHAAAKHEKTTGTYEPIIAFVELKKRIQTIDWLRYREHWIELTGAKVNKEGKRRTRTIKKTGEVVVEGQAQNTAAIIHAVTAKILSPDWESLTRQVNAKP